jgi:predicted Rossmann-fold nucleotide-binding protein
MLPLLFQPLRNQLYSADELLEGFTAARAGSYAESVDFKIYLQYVVTGRYAPTDYFTAMMEAVHDNAIREATQDYLKSVSAKAAVAFMGGHDLPRTSAVYSQVAWLARDLARSGFLPISGGGPGAMEATHLGALHQNASPRALTRALAELARFPALPTRLQDVVAQNGKIDQRLVRQAHAWLLPAYQIRQRIRNPGESLAIPTWLYGHEPTTPLATKIAKYFQNSVREDRLLAIATHGAIYVEGRAGTLQEIFQDATQNYYRIQGEFSPMIFLGTRQWTETLPAIPLLKKLFNPDDFDRYVCVTDEPERILDFIRLHGRQETPAQRMTRWQRKEGLPTRRSG